MLGLAKWLASKISKEPHPLATGVILDYRTPFQRFGHSCSLDKKEPEELFNGAPLYFGPVFGEQVKVGDQIRLMKSNREVLFMVKMVEDCDECDMHFIEAYPVSYK